ncbi:hypothetical protein HS961_07675 [Comamonas piscis]|uniref:Tetratricopeptide repeat protein n=1 Tax=Comamonas piscis TaxID=1562974 RepID=A0A7G5EFF4_9BURK|nr:hypothetical protein [Comamonas piscis]QMV72729.1 hypothetical protein HS961_07675 [Comamonas piscis]WSO35503.1 hypothetical protein VUJ63_07700 [Comamonas piscis]
MYSPDELRQLQALVAQWRAGDWHAAHNGVQHYPGLLAAWLHGILHLQEGDLEDAENWYDRAGKRFRQRETWEQELAQLEEAMAQALEQSTAAGAAHT